MNTENKVAKIIKVYAILNGISGLLLAFILLEYYDFAVKLFFIGAVAVVSFGIYAFGEIIELLHQIKKNTANVSKQVVDNSLIANDDLPEL